MGFVPESVRGLRGRYNCCWREAGRCVRLKLIIGDDDMEIPRVLLTGRCAGAVATGCEL